MKDRKLNVGRFALSGLALATACLWGLDARALGLGQLRVQSALGEPLRAEIDVTSLSSEEAATLVLRVAPPDAACGCTTTKAMGTWYALAGSGNTKSAVVDAGYDPRTSLYCAATDESVVNWYSATTRSTRVRFGSALATATTPYRSVDSSMRTPSDVSRTDVASSPVVMSSLLADAAFGRSLKPL